MCGIAGIVGPHGLEEEQALAALERMADALVHRGPDGEGYLVCDDSGHVRLEQERRLPRRGAASVVAGFAHRRLTILDLTSAAAQPMVDPTGTLAVTYNGEIYNFVELRAELAALGHTFRTEGDTEVVLHAYWEWGASCVERFIGMWALAILDTRRQTLFLSRDRMGIKPLFYSALGETFYFASEIRALLAAKALRRKPEDQTVARFLASGIVDDRQKTFFEGIKRIPPAHNMTVALEPGCGAPRLTRYWAIPSDRVDADGREVSVEFRRLLENAISIHARSDVPVGTCLSGGLDSSAIVCIANELRREGAIPQYKHAAFGFVGSDEHFSERVYMDAVVAQTGVRMTYVEIEGSVFTERAMAMAGRHDEPFGSASILAQWFVFEAARAAGMKVMLDGQGADEVLGGYHSYFAVVARGLLSRKRLRSFGRLDRLHRRAFGSPVLGWPAVAGALAPSAARAARPLLARAGRGFGGDAIAAVAAPLMKAQTSNGDEATDWRSLNDALAAHTERLNLPGLLRYEDRNSMAHSVEARVPFLDHRLVEFAFRLPDDQKVRGTTTKRVLREAVAGMVPTTVLERRDKVGFRADPDATWRLAHDHSASLIRNANSHEDRWFHPPAVERLIHTADRSAENEFLLWRLVSTKLWSRHFWGEA